MDSNHRSLARKSSVFVAEDEIAGTERGSQSASASPTTPQGPNRYVVDIVWIKERARAGAETNEATGASFGEAMQCSLDTNSPIQVCYEPGLRN